MTPLTPTSGGQNGPVVKSSLTSLKVQMKSQNGSETVAVAELRQGLRAGHSQTIVQNNDTASNRHFPSYRHPIDRKGICS